mgnify:FL=1|jgi:hypothetical protein
MRLAHANRFSGDYTSHSPERQVALRVTGNLAGLEVKGGRGEKS